MLDGTERNSVQPSGPVRIRDAADFRRLSSQITIPPEALKRKLPEWITFQKLCQELMDSGTIYHLGNTKDSQGLNLPLIALSFGNQNPEAPTLGLFGGVHGLERIGSQVVLAFMHSFSELILWDRLLQEALKQIRVLFFPLVNPLGIYHRTRANPNGVDLMRNAPIECTDSPTYLVGGHRLSPKIPWFRGYLNQKMEVESQAVLDFCQSQFFQSKRAVTLDFHSGFGSIDRIWFPFAKSKKPFPHLPEVHALKEAFERIHPHHFYKIEPQAKNYTTHGDLWDYAYERFYANQSNQHSIYLPLAVEMGSWAWVKKNPMQAFSLLGPYNPMKPHRVKRILRRHNSLFDFMIRSLVSHEVWVPSHADQREKHRLRAMELWYE